MSKIGKLFRKVGSISAYLESQIFGGLSFFGRPRAMRCCIYEVGRFWRGKMN